MDSANDDGSTNEILENCEAFHPYSHTFLWVPMYLFLPSILVYMVFSTCKMVVMHYIEAEVPFPPLDWLYPPGEINQGEMAMWNILSH